MTTFFIIIGIISLGYLLNFIVLLFDSNPMGMPFMTRDMARVPYGLFIVVTASRIRDWFDRGDL